MTKSYEDIKAQIMQRPIQDIGGNRYYLIRQDEAEELWEGLDRIRDHFAGKLSSVSCEVNE